MVERRRSSVDERTVIITLTGKGANLKKKALEVPERMAYCMRLPVDEIKDLKDRVEKLLRVMDES